MIRKAQISNGLLVNLDKEANNETFLLGLALDFNKRNPVDDPAGFFEELSSKDYVGKILMLEKQFGKELIFETNSADLFRQLSTASRSEKRTKRKTKESAVEVKQVEAKTVTEPKAKTAKK